MANKTHATRVVVLQNPKKSQSHRVGVELLAWLSERVTVVGTNIDTPSQDWSDWANTEIDYAVVLGGDGTILSTAREMGDRSIPIIGVNTGKLGFLAKFSVEELKETLDEVVTAPQLISHRNKLQCTIENPEKPAYTMRAINEIAIVAGPPFRMIELEIAIGEEELAFCAGDGLIFATPTGSTAYNLSAGGPILAAELDAVVVTPLAAHSLSFRPIVIGLTEPIVVRCRAEHYGRNCGGSHGGTTMAMVVVDGQKSWPLRQGDAVRIDPMEQRFRLVQNPRQSEWRLLNTKLNWGAPPNYARQADPELP